MTTAAIVGNLLLFLGAALLIGAASLFHLARSSRSWASAPGRVTSSKIDRSFDMTAPMRMDHRLLVTYEYEVDGRTLRGRRVAFGDTFWAATSSRDRAERIGRDYPQGQAVTVFYDPAHPGRCTLTRDVEAAGFYKLLAVALGLLVVGLAVSNGQIRLE